MLYLIFWKLLSPLLDFFGQYFSGYFFNIYAWEVKKFGNLYDIFGADSSIFLHYQIILMLKPKLNLQLVENHVVTYIYVILSIIIFIITSHFLFSWVNLNLHSKNVKTIDIKKYQFIILSIDVEDNYYLNIIPLVLTNKSTNELKTFLN
jgi:hypothetical protein